MRFGPQGLAQATLVGGDQARRRRQDVLRRPIVPLQPDDLGAWKVAFEAQDVVHLRPPPAIDRLVVIPHAAQVLALLRQQPQPQVLGDVGVLVLVHQQVAEPAVVVGQHVGMLGEQGDVVQQQVAEVAGVQYPQPLLIERIQARAAIVGEMAAL